ncbi:hypothetical protein Tco_0558248 [Tanacetum coccineum]
MDDPDITIEEYFSLKLKKQCRRVQGVITGKLLQSGKVVFLKYLLFKDLRTSFPAIVYKDALTSEPEVSSEPMEDTAYMCLHFTRNHKELKSNTSYPEDFIRRIQKILYAVSKIEYLKIVEDIERGLYSKKPLIHRIDLNQYGVSTNFQAL